MTKNNVKVDKTDNKKDQEVKENKKYLDAAIRQIDQKLATDQEQRVGKQKA